MKNKILFVFRYPSSFVKNDLEILKENYDVIPLHATNNLLKTLFKFLLYTRKVDLIFVWFAGHQAFLSVLFAKIFRKKSIVVAGGYDVANVPELNYGAFTRLKKRLPAKFALKFTDMVLAVSNFTKSETLRQVRPKRIEVVYNGVNIERFKPAQEKEDNLVITVSGINWLNLKRKGIETFVKSAKFTPKAHFVVIGKFIDNSIDYLKSIASSNIKFTDLVSDEDLIKWYQKTKVICQLSYYEAFGLAPAECMACGCIPVVTEKGGLPEIVGDTGFYVPYDDEKATAEAIKQALASPKKGKKARKRIISSFSIKEREKQLVKIINELIEIKGEKQ